MGFLMIKLRDALKLNDDELREIKEEIKKKVEASSINAYIIDDVSLDVNSKGVPILIKDNISVKNWPLTCASNILKGYVSPYNASVINKLLDSNLTPFGRANMDEFAMGSTTQSSCYGPTKNPNDISRIPGGSSGGSAAAVASGLAIASLGSDTGGSIRQPAGLCGCVGLKPTYGSVSRYGLVAYSSSLDQIGPLTQDVEDCALLFDFIKGYDAKDSTSIDIDIGNVFDNLDSNRKFKVGILKDFLKDSSKVISDSYFDVVKILESLGHSLKEISMLDTKYHISSYYIISMAEASSNLARFDGIRYGNLAKEAENLKDLYFKTRSLGFGEEVKNRILMGNFVLQSGYYDKYYAKAQIVRKLIAKEYEKIFKDVDVNLSPTSPDVAPKIGKNESALDMYLSDIYTIGINLSGLPALCIPISKNPLPIGIQFIGNNFREQDIFDIALNLQNELRIAK